MARKKQEPITVSRPRCLDHSRSVGDSHGMGRFLSSLIYDLASGAVNVELGTALIKGSGKIIKNAELRYRYGSAVRRDAPNLQLV